MRTDLLKSLPYPRLVLAAVAVTAACLPPTRAHAQNAGSFPATYADPAVPLLQLPTDFRARRTTANMNCHRWASVYLNGQQVAMLDHAEEFDAVKIPVTLNKADNQLLIKTNNRQNRERLLWAIHCAVE